MHDSQDLENIISVHNEFIQLAKERDYDEILFSMGELEKQNGKTFVKGFINFQNDNDKTLIHHMIENPSNSYFDELWAIIELHLRGANLNLQDNLGNTALHSCAYFHIDKMKAQIQSHSLTDYASCLSLGLNEVEVGARPADEKIMFACMAEVGGLLYCGADSTLKNQKGNTVFELMSSVATMLTPASIKPNISVESCKKAFLTLSDFKKTYFFVDELKKSSKAFSEATNKFQLDIEEKDRELKKLEIIISKNPLSKEAEQARSLRDESIKAMLQLSATMKAHELSHTKQLEQCKINKGNSEGKVFYPWAPNVISWVESLQVGNEVKNASLGVTQVTTTSSSSGCLMM